MDYEYLLSLYKPDNRELKRVYVISKSGIPEKGTELEIIDKRSGVREIYEIENIRREIIIQTKRKLQGDSSLHEGNSERVVVNARLRR